MLKLWNVVLRVRVTFSSVGGRGVYTPPIGLSTKMQNKKNTFLALLRRVFALEWSKSDLKQLLKHKFRGALICQTHRSMKTLKNNQKQAIKFDR